MMKQHSVKSFDDTDAVAPAGSFAATLREFFPRASALQEPREAARLLAEVGRRIGLPWPTWVPDMSDADSQDQWAFSDEVGWPRELREEYRKRRYGSKGVISLRSHLALLPFVHVHADNDSTTSLANRDDRAIAQMVLDLGLVTHIIVPLHLPRAHVGALTWSGNVERAHADAIVEEASAEILLLAHTFASQMERRWHDSREPEDLARLTGRERECLRLIAMGYHVPTIAAKTETAETTVRYHLDNARTKLGAASQTHAVALAVQLGLLGRINR